MTQSTIDQQRMEAATRSVGAKWQRLTEDLTTDERAALGLALRDAVGGDATTDDVAGYDYAIELARRYVDALPIWDSLKAAVAQMTRPINWNP